jgi:hypothetical protein
MKRCYRHCLWLVAAVLLLPACSNKQLYEAVRENRLQDCERQPPGAVEDCKREFATDYEAYESARREADSDSPN